MYVAKRYCVYLWTEPEVCHGYYKLFCYYFLPQQSDVLSPGHPLLPETPKPGYFSLSHKLILHWQLFFSIMELHGQPILQHHKDLLFYQTNKTQF